MIRLSWFQSTVGAKINSRGKEMQYRRMKDKGEARILYEEFTKLCQKMVLCHSKITSEHPTGPHVKWGTYAMCNQHELLTVKCRGPYTHVLDF
ncbi:putative D-tyrosyl-tRNA(Tyr) deacylase 2 [Exaiptasia diaphana]|nr:putative D-tyrosyl-tRNA(Tyr) deacylase 2 [Exaiptasia diaphana]